MSGILFYVLAFVPLLGVLIIVHEYGHYLVARLVGVKVLRFSVGFGRALWSIKIGPDGTEWSIGMFPLGGYVKMLDEREGVVNPDELHRSFNRQKVWRRMAIVVAGPIANLLLAVLVYWGLFWHGTEELKPILGTPVAASPAAGAGVENGERVLKVGNEMVQTWQDMHWALIRQAVNQNVIELEVVNQRSEIAFRHLDVSTVRAGGWEGDAFEKLGLGFYRPRIPPILGKVSPDGAAAAGGLIPGDEILAIDDKSLSSWADVVHSVRNAPGKAMIFLIRRNEAQLAISITPDTFDDGGQRIGRIGAAVSNSGVTRSDLMITVRYGLVSALGKAIDETWNKSAFSLEMIGKMIVGEVSWRNLSGPVTIADYAGQSARLGTGHYLKFLALVSISLAVLNLLPIPILDGGHLLYYVVEIITKAPLSERNMEIGQQIGLALMLMLMAFAFYNDINRLISG
ncbi:RIP metalloprotease RseP [Propionivibrio sp.]|uniref:RIP metalloprotease RseP n=1 Tax=Propionivibrio sp. TaxID=2212460 RepID=UPI0025F0CDE9|nr:RIP metalloprotease RseP [Propionivibrio sp.]MBK7356511.1 RIP metalloprotease RseP [Propionivibrio sp.]MBK8400924.1 RIP metalloprotease RseP [Propionivibrio sp.]MBK8745284.1 RIP metalloprotease RseP [Propionivibrio sp.]MBK8894209.1 RIP metalloprotease RseP [Propionivibrio sp.]MBL0207666.1 RIP metalloprotease RseP [Propionivibrio sp.]